MRVHILGSGSDGNAIVLEGPQQSILVEDLNRCHSVRCRHLLGSGDQAGQHLDAWRAGRQHPYNTLAGLLNRVVVVHRGGSANAGRRQQSDYTARRGGLLPGESAGRAPGWRRDVIRAPAEQCHAAAARTTWRGPFAAT